MQPTSGGQERAPFHFFWPPLCVFSGSSHFMFDGGGEWVDFSENQHGATDCPTWATITGANVWCCDSGWGCLFRLISSQVAV